MLRDMNGFEARIPTTDEMDWQMNGECRNRGPELFFHPNGERGKARMSRETRAKEICRACDVLIQCRDYALKTGEPNGTWGGMSETEREMYHRAKRRRRPASE